MLWRDDFSHKIFYLCMKSYGATIQMKLAVPSHDTICFVRILVVLTFVSQWMKSHGVTIQEKLRW